MMVGRMNDRNMSKMMIMMIAAAAATTTIIIIIIFIIINERLVSGCFVRVDRIANGYVARRDYVAQTVRIVYCIT